MKLSLAATSVLHAIQSRVRHGFDIMDATGLPSGTVYPILGRLERAGLIHGRWEDAALAHADKRPPRRYYEVTAPGRVALAEAIRHYRTLGGRLPEDAEPAGG